MSNATRVPNPKSSRRTLLILIGLTVVPAVAAWVMYFFFPPSDRMNYGTLVNVRPLPDVALADVSGKPASLKSLRGKWLLISVEPPQCTGICEKNLAALNTARTLQNREQDRIVRVWLMTGEGAPGESAAKLTSNVRIFRVAPEAVSAVLANEPNPIGHSFVVDPLGNLVLRYPPQPDPKKISKDLKRLLRASNIG